MGVGHLEVDPNIQKCVDWVYLLMVTYLDFDVITDKKLVVYCCGDIPIGFFLYWTPCITHVYSRMEARGSYALLCQRAEM